MANIKEPTEMIAEFLRARLTDPRGRYTEKIENTTGSAAQTVINLNPGTGNIPRCITSLVIDSATKKKYEDYDIDLYNKKLSLKTALSGGESISVTYQYSTSGNEWIYPDMPRKKLGVTKFPRIAITDVGETGKRMGVYDASVVSDVHLQIDFWTKERYSKTYSSENYADDDLARYFIRLIETAFNDYIDDLYPYLHDYTKFAHRSMPFDKEYEAYHRILEVGFRGINIGGT